MKIKRTVGKTLKRIRRENKTNYDKRLNMLKSGSLRVVFRKSNRYVQAQLIESVESRDKVIVNISSKELLEYGWPKESSNSLKSIPASYFTGLVIAHKIDEKTKSQGLIVDFGMYRNVHKSKLYAFIKGLQDGGIKITTKKEIFPDEERLKGVHLKNDAISKKFDEIKKKIGAKK